MPTLAEKPPDKYIKALVYAMAKLGKTFGAGTFPRPNFIDCDNGIRTLLSKDFVSAWGDRTTTIQYQNFKERSVDARGVPKDHNAFDDVCRYFDASMAVGKRDSFDTWVVDTGTSLTAFAMNKALVLLGGKSFKGGASATLAEGQLHGLILPKKQDYGSERSLIEQFIAMLYDTDKHFIFLCHEREVIDEATGRTSAITPLLTGKGVQSVSAMFHEVWRLVGEREGPHTIRKLQTDSDGVRMAGSRASLPTGTRWDYDSIVKAMQSVNILSAKEQQNVPVNSARP